MNSIFRQGISAATLFQLVADLSWLFIAGILVIRFNEQLAIPLDTLIAPVLVFAVVMLLLNIAFGMYQRADNLMSSTYLVRMLLVPAIGFPLAYLIANALPTGRLLQDHLLMAVLVAVGGLLLIRHVIVLPLVANLVPHRILVLGTGPEARLVEASLAAANMPGSVRAGSLMTITKLRARLSNSSLGVPLGASILATALVSGCSGPTRPLVRR